jgi:serine/threonine protein kinase
MTVQQVYGATVSIGDVLADRYRLEALIGYGGAADVHRATDLRLGRTVAVKGFRTGAEDHPGDRFIGEAVLLAGLHHPGVVTVYDAGRHEGLAYLVMQLVDGPTLRHRICERALTPHEVSRLGAHLARTLAYVHTEGVVHRDIKPSNILLDGEGRPYITDFGISRTVDATAVTGPGELVGTAPYLAPEQILGQAAQPSADVYALGLVLLECLTARIEYSGIPVEAAVARLHRSPRIPQALPAELAAMLEQMTAMDPDDRPDAGACARVLESVAEGFGSAGEARHRHRQPRRQPRRHPGPAPRPAGREDGRRGTRIAVASAAAALAGVLGSMMTFTTVALPHTPEMRTASSPAHWSAEL